MTMRANCLELAPNRQLPWYYGCLRLMPREFDQALHENAAVTGPHGACHPAQRYTSSALNRLLKPRERSNCRLRPLHRSQCDYELLGGFPFFRPIAIHIDEKQFSAFSRDLGENGIGLVHSFDLPCDEVAITIREGEESIRVRTKIVWCEPCGEGWYLSGGEFIGLAVE